MKKFFRALLVVGSVSCSLADVSKPRDRSWLPTVNLGYEIHQATFNQSGNYYNFSNIRYGAPPVESLRFSAPTAPTANHPVFNDGSKAVTCIQAVPAWTNYSVAWLTELTAAFNITAGYQPPNITVMPPQDPQESEDCLFLDIMVPKAIFNRAGQPGGAPVMVWIHGGGYTLGSKVEYSPSAAGLIGVSEENGSEGIVWVAMNYRLGIFGFLSGPTFQASGTANAGLHDQRFALEWIQQNIHKFGGDPNRVTVIGESAGGGSTMHQITAYGGLKGKVPFQQAIVQSPGYQPMPSLTGQEAVFQKFLETANVGTLQEARGLSSQELQFVNYKIVGESSPYGTFTFNPAVDGEFVPALPSKLLLQGGFDQSLRVMAGHNLDEGLEFMDPFAQDEARFEADLRIYFPTITDAAIQYISQTLYPPIFDGSYGYTTPTFRSDLFITEAFFTCNTNWLAHAYENKTFNYIFSVYPALHGDDIWYTYFNGPSTLVKNDTLAVIMQRYFTNFVETGNPNGKGVPYFPQNGTGSVCQDLNLTFVGQMKDDTANARCTWWQKGLYS